MIENILSRLNKVKRISDGKWTACCSAHEDKTPSLAITQVPDGRILMHCFGGCDTGSIMEAMGLSLGDLFPEGAKDNHLYGATPWRRGQRKSKEKTLEKEKLILDMADADRAKGRKLSQKDLDRERLAFERLRNKVL